MLADIAQLLERVHHSLGRAFANACYLSNIGQVHGSPGCAKAAQYRETLLQRLIEKGVNVFTHDASLAFVYVINIDIRYL